MVKRRLSEEEKTALLTQAAELKNISEACKEFGISRDTYYAIIRSRSQSDSGFDGGLSNARSPLRLPVETEARILEVAADQYWLGKKPVAALLREEGIPVSENGVRQVFVRHNLTTEAKRAEFSRAQNGEDLPPKPLRPATPAPAVDCSAVGAEVLSDFTIPTERRDNIRRETDLVHKFAESQGTTDGTFTWPGEKSNNSFLAQRLIVLRASNLFLDPTGTGSVTSPGNDRIVDMMTRVATQCHNLGYAAHPKPGRWSFNSGKKNSGRSESWLRPHISGSNETVQRQTIQWVDLALIAHSFGLPAAIWKISDLEVFKSFVAMEAKFRRVGAGHVNPKLPGSLIEFEAVDILESLVSGSPEKFEVNNVRAGDTSGNATIRKHGEKERPRKPTGLRVDAHVPLRFSFTVPDGFVGGACCLFEIDEDRDIAVLTELIDAEHVRLRGNRYVYPHGSFDNHPVTLYPSKSSRIVVLFVSEREVPQLLGKPFITDTSDLSGVNLYHSLNLATEDDRSLRNTIRVSSLIDLLLGLGASDRRVLGVDVVVG